MLWLLIPLISVTAVLTGVALNRPSARGAWLLFALALLLGGLSDALWTWPQIGGHLLPVHVSAPDLVDALYLSSYVALFAGIFLLVRRLTPGRDRAAILDALIVGTAAALTSWVFLVQPVLATETLTSAQVLRCILYPVLDVLFSSRPSGSGSPSTTAATDQSA